MTALVQNPFHNPSLGMLRDSRACLSDAAGKGIHLNDKSCDDDADAFPVLSSIGVKREAGASASEQFDAGNSVDINVLNWDGFDGSWSEKQRLLHCRPPFVTGELYGKNIESQAAWLSFYRLNKIVSASFQKHRKPIEIVKQDSCAYEREPCSKFKDVFRHLVLLLPPGESCGRVARGQLASAFNGVRTFYSRALSSCVDVLQENPCNRAKQSWRMVGALHFQASPHVGHNNMRGFSGGQILFAKGASNV